MAKGEEMSGLLTASVRSAISEMATDGISLYQQRATDDNGRLRRVLGDRDGQRVESFIFPRDPIEASYRFDLVSMNDATNPTAEIQRLIQLNQMNVNYWSVIFQQLQVALQATQIPPPFGQKFLPLFFNGVEQAIVAQTKLQQKLLEAGGIDDIDRLTLALRGGLSQSQTDLRALAGELGSVGGSLGAVPQPGVEQLGDPAAGGAAVPPGGLIGGPPLQ